MSKDVESKWTEAAKAVLLGRTIVEVRYLNDQEMDDLDWESKSLVFKLDNGIECILCSDDEGNDGGTLMYSDGEILPVL